MQLLSMEIRDMAQLEKGKLEDTIVDLLYSKYEGLVFHGGTAIWRCYGGIRFSRDLDFYLGAKTQSEKMHHYKEVSEFLKSSGFSVKEKGYEKRTDTMHFLVESNTKMKIDFNFRYKRGTHAEYTRIDDSKIVVLALSPAELLQEKIMTYKDKLVNADRFKQPEVQDLYDIYYLVSLVKSGDKKTARDLNSLIALMGRHPPPNMASLGHLILSGLAPSFEMMLDKISKWSDDNS